MKGDHKLMNPIIYYQFAKTYHDEYTRELDEYWRYHQDEPAQPRGLSPFRPILGWGSVILGIFIIVQLFIG